MSYLEKPTEMVKNCNECPRKDTDKCWVKQTGEIAGACPDLI